MKKVNYVLLMTLVTSFYLFFRYTLEDSDLESLSDYEFKSFAVLGFLLIIRLIRLESWLGYFVFGVKVLHVILCGLMFQFNVTYSICYAVILIIVHFGVEPPFFEVSYRVATLTNYLLKPYIEEVPECMVLFYTTWEGRCISVMPVFSEISEKYTSQNLLFARFDIGKHPEMEKEYKISATNGNLRQIPTIIHFKEGKEVKRLNPAIAQEKIMNYPTIVKYFKLGAPPKNEKKTNKKKR